MNETLNAIGIILFVGLLFIGYVVFVTASMTHLAKQALEEKENSKENNNVR